jgi:CelD/BcsL family acetyltransferase involved in cellulose biosynthesis
VPELGRWAAQWDALVDLAPLPSPFLRSWWLAATSGLRGSFLLVVDSDELLGGLAVEQGHRLGLPCVQMMGTGSLCPDHLDVLAAPGHDDLVLAAVRSWLGRPGPRLIDLQGIRSGSRLIAALPGRVRCSPEAEAPWVRLPADPATYLADRPNGLRKTIRRAGARLAEQGVHHRVIRGASVAESLTTLRSMHELQWGEQSRFLPEFTRFAAACRMGAELDEVAVHELGADGTVVATMVSFEVARRVSLYQSARLTSHPWRDATTVLLSAIIADACRGGFTEVDFLRGTEGYKDNFAPERRELLRLRAADGWGVRMTLALENAARTVKRSVRP